MRDFPFFKNNAGPCCRDGRKARCNDVSLFAALNVSTTSDVTVNLMMSLVIKKIQVCQNIKALTLQ